MAKNVQPSPENEMIFREAVHEKYRNDTAGEALFHRPKARGKPGTVRPESGQGFYPETNADARCADLSHSHHGRKSIWKGLLGHFQKRIDTPSTSAFVQQRQKLLPSAFEALFH